MVGFRLWALALLATEKFEGKQHHLSRHHGVHDRSMHSTCGRIQVYSMNMNQHEVNATLTKKVIHLQAVGALAYVPQLGAACVSSPQRCTSTSETKCDKSYTSLSDGRNRQDEIQLSCERVSCITQRQSPQSAFSKWTPKRRGRTLT